MMGTKGGLVTIHRALALFACAALLFFAAGGALLHQHTNGPDAACHICQTLHLPALAAAPLDLVSEPEPVTWYSSLPHHAGTCDSFALHHAGRAPPAAFFPSTAGS
jgi:hypothetical protein